MAVEIIVDCYLWSEF